jgi:tetratricopeptide (TPR) repeat protein
MKLWLFATTMYIEADQLDEANKAMMEMEAIGAGMADTWHQMGCICVKAAETTAFKRRLWDMALETFKKALTLDEDHVATHVDMAKVFISLEEWEIAESLLERTTRSFGWDHSEAWYLLGLAYQQDRRLDLDRAKNCLLYALELNDTSTIAPPLKTLPRYV